MTPPPNGGGVIFIYSCSALLGQIIELAMPLFSNWNASWERLYFYGLYIYGVFNVFHVDTQTVTGTPHAPMIVNRPSSKDQSGRLTGILFLSQLSLYRVYIPKKWPPIKIMFPVFFLELNMNVINMNELCTVE